MPRWYFLLFLLGFGIDQLSKTLSTDVVVNGGVSFSLFSQINPTLTTIALGFFLMFMALATFPSAQKDKKLLACHALFFAGALSNWLDRIFFDGVRDIWPFFGVRNNLADWLIVGSALVVGLRLSSAKIRS